MTDNQRFIDRQKIKLVGADTDLSSSRRIINENFKLLSEEVIRLKDINSLSKLTFPSTFSAGDMMMLRAERDEELQRLSLEKATSIEDLKERQKKEEASIREKYQTLFDKKLEEYKDSLGDAIHDFAKDIERGIENGIKSNPIFQ